jgi:hypothetical protein
VSLCNVNLRAVHKEVQELRLCCNISKRMLQSAGMPAPYTHLGGNRRLWGLKPRRGALCIDQHMSKSSFCFWAARPLRKRGHKSRRRLATPPKNKKRGVGCRRVYTPVTPPGFGLRRIHLGFAPLQAVSETREAFGVRGIPALCPCPSPQSSVLIFAQAFIL